MAAKKIHNLPAGRSHIVLRLKQGWKYVRSRRRFDDDRGGWHEPKQDLPKYTRINVQVPDLESKKDRTEAEDELARGVQIVPPKDEKLEKLIAVVRGWPCVEKAWICPDIQPAKETKKGSSSQFSPPK